MSFTKDVAEELILLPIKKTCCRKVFLLGLLFAFTEEEGVLRGKFRTQSAAETAVQLLDKVFHAKAELTKSCQVGRQSFIVTVRCGAIASFLRSLDDGKEGMLHSDAGFRCACCPQEFLRGVFLGCATVSDPHKEYHLEFLIPTEGRAEALSGLLISIVGKCGRVRRRDKFGVYYKSNGSISDLLYYIGCAKGSFNVANVCIERDIRNNENRATNCVASNISRSVGASQKQKAAVEKLIANRRIDALSEELRYTAKLRMEYDSASLAELAMLHEPPISKSGLNRRLAKLIESAEED